MMMQPTVSHEKKVTWDTLKRGDSRTLAAYKQNKVGNPWSTYAEAEQTLAWELPETAQGWGMVITTGQLDRKAMTLAQHRDRSKGRIHQGDSNKHCSPQEVFLCEPELVVPFLKHGKILLDEPSWLSKIFKGGDIWWTTTTQAG